MVKQVPFGVSLYMKWRHPQGGVSREIQHKLHLDWEMVSGNSFMRTNVETIL
jgi:hypothetical protein